jgi:mRNA-degrading endonuclease RelE of RelBE toxin-antitoxin system
MKARADAAPGSAEEAVYKGMRKILDELLSHEERALDRSNGCRLGNHDFGNVFRQKLGRYRIFYIVSKAHQQSTVLFIGYRKEGDKNDAYAELSRRLQTDEFDPQFAELSVKKPKG